MRVFEITQGKKKLEIVAGLVWHPLEKTGSARTKEIRTFAEEGDFAFKVLRGTESPHVGLAKRAEGAKVRQISAAAVVADIASERGTYRDFIVAIPIPGDQDQYLQVMSHGGVILARGDRVGTRDEIRVQTVEDASYGKWDLLICPGEWEIPNSHEKSFDDFFNETALKKHGRWTLSDVTFPYTKYLIPALLLLSASAASAYGYRVWTTKRMAAAEALRLQNEEVSRGQRTAVAAPVKPWPGLPRPADFAAACDAGAKRVGYVAGNWKFNVMECGDGQVKGTWDRSSPNAWISHLKMTRPDAILSPDGNSASVSVQVTAPAANDFTESVPRQEDAALRFMDISSRYGIVVSISPPAAPLVQQTLPGQQGAALPPPPPWVEVPVDFRTGIDPVEAAGLLQLPGLRINKISHSVVSGAFQYSLSGVQYVHR